MLEVSYWCLDTGSRVVVWSGKSTNLAAKRYAQLVSKGLPCVAIDRVPAPKKIGCSERQFLRRIGFAVLAFVGLIVIVCQ